STVQALFTDAGLRLPLGTNGLIAEARLFDRQGNGLDRSVPSADGANLAANAGLQVSGVPYLVGTSGTFNRARDIGGVSATAPDTGVLAVAGGTFSLALSAGTPVPTGSDLADENGAALLSAAFQIRDTANHFIRIPMS